MGGGNGGGGGCGGWGGKAGIIVTVFGIDDAFRAGGDDT